MKFKNWLRLNEMPHFSVHGNLSIPCNALIHFGMTLPCVPDKKIGMIDMRFEFYPKGGFDWTKLAGFGGKWIAKIPESTQYLVYDGEAKLMFANEAMKQGFLSQAQQPGSQSEKGYVLLPEDWLKYAILLDQDYEVIKQ